MTLHPPLTATVKVNKESNWTIISDEASRGLILVGKDGRIISSRQCLLFVEDNLRFKHTAKSIVGRRKSVKWKRKHRNRIGL